MTTELSQHDEADDAGRQEDDFLAAWRDHQAEQEDKREFRDILGVRVEVPTDLPLVVEKRLEELADSTSEDDIKAVLKMVFGQDPLDAWVEAGITGRMFQVLLAWAISNGQGKPTTFREAIALVAKAEKAEAEGKGKTVPNRAERRKASSATRASGKAGPSSARTSGASTKSARKKSGG